MRKENVLGSCGVGGGYLLFVGGGVGKWVLGVEVRMRQRNYL